MQIAVPAGYRLVRTEWYPLLDVSRGSVPELPEEARASLRSERFFALEEGLSHFSRVFKQAEGSTPRAYREALAG